MRRSACHWLTVRRGACHGAPAAVSDRVWNLEDAYALLDAREAPLVPKANTNARMKLA